jgi:metallo-beta-lactamase family protein
MSCRITFLGAAGTVTGSRHLLETDDKRLLIDCGLFQGKKENRLKNWDNFPVASDSIDSVLLTHAHIDHTGYLPRLCKTGFTGTIYGTAPTVDLCGVLLPDTAHLQEEEAKWANKRGYSKHRPALPLFTGQDAENTLKLMKAVQYGEHFHPAKDVRAKYRDTGHILGAGFLDLKSNRLNGPRKIVFSGDLGRPVDALLRPPAQPYNVDYLILESTYGNRLHDEANPIDELVRVINESTQRGGVVVIPSFAVGRTQTLLYILRELEQEGRIPELPVFVDSPMALEALQIHYKHVADFNLASRKKHIAGVELFHTAKLKLCPTRQDSMAINDVKEGAIIISASGMAAGGRILHHLRERLPEERHTILFIGYQAEGTRGRLIMDGRESVRMFGEEIPVRAKVESIPGFSGHADYNEILAWLMGFNRPPERVFIVHGEPTAAHSMAEHIRRQFKWDVTVPNEGDSFILNF